MPAPDTSSGAVFYILTNTQGKKPKAAATGPKAPARGNTGNIRFRKEENDIYINDCYDDAKGESHENVIEASGTVNNT